jgi:hypothetical protein
LISTDISGNFSFIVPYTSSPFEGSLTVSYSGYASNTIPISVVVQAGGTITQNISLSPIINGTCGTANGTTVTSAPSTNLCATGTATTVTGTGLWNWSCGVSNGGTTADCSAPIQTYTITANVTGGNGTVSCPSPVNYGATSTCTVTPANGYQIDTLTDNSIDNKGSVSGGSYNIPNITANHTVVATFNLIPSSQVNGTCGTSNNSTFPTVPATNFCTTGTATTLTGTGPWSWSCTGSNGGTTEPCSANIATYTVTPSAGTNGTITPNTPQTVNSGSTTSFTITPNTGYQTVTPVGGTCGGTLTGNTYTTTAITAPCTVSPTFSTNQYTTSSTVTGGNGMASCTNSVNYGATSTCTITPSSGYRIATFTDNGTDQKAAITGNSYSITAISANHTITATFEQIPDSTPPTIIITDPPGNSTQTDVWQLTATASDNVGVTSVDFSVKVIINNLDYYLNSSYTFTRTSIPIWLPGQRDMGDIWYRDTQPVNWSDNKSYTITARTSDVAGNPSTATATFMKVIVLPKDPSTLSLDLSSNSIANGGTVTVSGILDRFCSGSCTPINLMNRPVKVTIRNEAYTIVHQQDYQTTDTTGHYSTGPLSLFSSSGSYYIQTTYTGEADLQKSFSSTRTLLVGRPAGYAVIVQGKVASGEGNPEHTKSTRRAYQALKERNFTDDNIYWLNYGIATDPKTGQQLTVDDTAPTITKAGAIISGVAAFSSDGQTLAQRMSSNPAPLYIIMVDHGSPDQFHLSDGNITPTILDSWLNTLDSNITTSTARSEKKIIIIGACYSGSFIKQPLSKTGRTIITSANKGEVSYRGGFDGQDSVQSGEYFLDELFASFKRLSDIKTAFTEASEKTWRFTRKGGTANSNAPFTNAVQHPVLDDNGDGIGSIILSDGSGDGTSSKGIFLGVAPGSINSFADPADLNAVAPAIYLDSSQTSGIPPLWATAMNPSQVSSVYVELVRPTDQMTASTGTGQVRRPIDQAQAMTATGNRFEYTTFPFTTSGKYEAYYYAIDKDTGAASPSKRSLIYRDKQGNNKPTAPAAIEPGTDGLVPDPDNPANRIIPSTTIQFQWSAATDQDNDPLTYTLEICADASFTTGCKSYEEIVSTSRIVEGLTASALHHWRVWSVDPYTRSATSSTARSFTPQSSNPLLTTIRGQVIAGDNPTQVVSGVQITLKVPNLPDRAAVTKVDGTFEYLGVLMNASPFSFNLMTNHSSYASSSIPVSITPTGASINQVIALTAVATNIQTTLKAGWNLMGWTTTQGYYQVTAPLSTEHVSSATMSSMQMSDMFGTLGLPSTESFVIVGPDGVVYIPGSPFNTLKKALPGKAYWIYTPSDKTITVPGTALLQTDQLPLISGWNQIAYWGTDGVPPATGFNCIDGKYDILVDEAGKVYMKGSPFNTLKTLQKNKGYFIYTTAPATLVYQCL